MPNGNTCRITSYNVCYTKLLRVFSSRRLLLQGESMTVSELVARIEDSREGFLDIINGLDRSAARTPIGPGRWGLLEYLEHPVRAEEVTLWRMCKAVGDARSGGEILLSPTPGASNSTAWRTLIRSRAPSP